MCKEEGIEQTQDKLQTIAEDIKSIEVVRRVVDENSARYERFSEISLKDFNKLNMICICGYYTQ